MIEACDSFDTRFVHFAYAIIFDPIAAHGPQLVIGSCEPERHEFLVRHYGGRARAIPLVSQIIEIIEPFFLDIPFSPIILAIFSENRSQAHTSGLAFENVIRDERIQRRGCVLFFFHKIVDERINSRLDVDRARCISQQTVSLC